MRTIALTDAHPCPCSSRFACVNCRSPSGKRRLQLRAHAGELAVFCYAMQLRRYRDVEVTDETEMIHGEEEALRRVRLGGVLEVLEKKWAGEDHRRVTDAVARFQAERQRGIRLEGAA